MDFIAIDFETANENNDSACALGLVCVESLEIVKTEYYLMQPPTLVFGAKNIEIHGIRPGDVDNQPKFPEIWEKIKHYFSGDCPIAAHNASFDMSVLKCCLNTYGLEIPDFPYIDSITLSNPQCPDCKRSLSARAEFLEISLEHHHDGLEDAAACAGIITTCAKKSGYNNFGDFLKSFGKNAAHSFADCNYSKTFSGSPYLKSKTVTKRDDSPVALAQYICGSNEPEHPFVGKSLVLTGELSAMSRERATQEIIACGGIVKTAVSPKTDFLVVGTQQTSLFGGNTISTKQAKANSIIEKGGNIEILNEDEFLHYLDKCPRLVRSAEYAYLILQKILGLIPTAAAKPKQLYFETIDDRLVECVVNKVVSQYPQIVEITAEGKNINIHLDYLKEMQPTKKELEELAEQKAAAVTGVGNTDFLSSETECRRILEIISKLIDRRLFTQAKLEVKEPKVKNKHDIVWLLESNTYRLTSRATEYLLLHVVVSKSQHHITFPGKFKQMLESVNLQFSITSTNFLKVDLKRFYNFLANDSEAAGNLMNKMLISLLEYPPFDCCSHYMECSDKKSCIHTDYLYASGACNYKKQLESGRIFYGENRNV